MPTPLRLALDATPLYDVRSGVGRFVEEVLREAATRADLDVGAYAVTCRGQERLSELVPPGVRAIEPRLPLAAAPLRWAWRRSDRPRIDRWIGRADVVHGMNFVVPPTTAGAVVTVHDLTYLRYPEMCTADVLQYADLVPRALARGALVHTVSEFVRGELLDRYGVAPERVVAVPNGITAPGGGDATRGRSLAGGDRYVLAVGTVEPRKDLPGLVAAFDLVAADDADLRLVIAGADGWGAEALDQAVAASPHRARVVRLGWVGEAARAHLLAGALALVMASRYEGFGLPAAEAMAVGTPVIATAVGALPEVVGDAALLVAGGDHQALAGALATVAADPQQRAELAGRGRARARTYTWARTVDGLRALWAAAAAGT